MLPSARLTNAHTPLPSAQDLLDWYDVNRRSFPWRDAPTPYHVWISEIMLQQTRTEAVRDYYDRFLSALPTVEALAEAEEDVCLKLWQGLGYYSRVRNLHRAARQIVSDHQGKMPTSSAGLRKLSGIGPYTAAAIASICYDERIPAVDGNLLRVFARISGYNGSIKTDAAKKAAAAYYLSIFPQTRCGDMNQALMDLGATICLPHGQPLCESCPWDRCCLAHRQGLEEALPVTPKSKPRRLEDRTVFLIYYKQRLALRKREKKGLLAGLYEFPNAPGHLSREQAERFIGSMGFGAVRLSPLSEARHIFSHVEWLMTGWEVLADEWEDFSDGQPREHEIFLANAEDLEHVYSIPSAFRRYSDAIRWDFL